MNIHWSKVQKKRSSIYFIIEIINFTRCHWNRQNDTSTCIDQHLICKKIHLRLATPTGRATKHIKEPPVICYNYSQNA